MVHSFVMVRTRLALALAAATLFLGSGARAATGVCDANPPASTQACIDAIQTAGGVVNDIFKDAQGRTATQLPVFGTVFDNWPGCDTTSWAGCAGVSTAPYDCPGLYGCTAGVTNTIANAQAYMATVDHLWWHPCRLANHALVNGCPDRTCIADGVDGSYFPWEGLVLDLGGPANQVAIFAQNDHGPQPCESVEYTVFLTDNPLSQEIIDDPAVQGADPQKWNRAVLKKIFTHGWFDVRTPPDPVGHAACGDVNEYAVEDDSMTTLFALPCGITFRYTSLVAGYDGKEFPACAYHSQEGEVDAVAGLTEEGSGVCPDADLDHYVDCNCDGAPQPCDCDDANPAVHPGALEDCDDPDLDCDGNPGSCDAGQFCYESICILACQQGEIGICPPGATCASTDLGDLCVPDDCTTGACPPGTFCDPVTKTCRPACEDVQCPVGQLCQDGKCIDPCKTVDCPAGQVCVEGECHPPCNCFNADVGCTAPEVCDRGNTDLCVPLPCQGVACAAGEHCDDQGNCAGVCDGVVCPIGQKCDAAKGECVDNCSDVTCNDPEVCNPDTGACEDHTCDNVPCFAPAVCVQGQCVAPDGGVPDGGTAGSGAGGAGNDASAGTGPTDFGSRGDTVADPGGCGCRDAGGSSGSLLALPALALAAALARRKKDRQCGSRGSTARQRSVPSEPTE